MSSLKKPTFITLVPGVFMFFITCTYLLSSSKLGAPIGLPLPLNVSYIIAAILGCGAGFWAVRRGKKMRD